MATTDFITTWRTVADNEEIIFFASSTSNNFNIDWGDGNQETITAAYPAHTYAVAGDYDITVDGVMPNMISTSATKNVLDVKQWGDTGLISCKRAFYQQTLIAGFSAIDDPNLSAVTEMRDMFTGATSFNGVIGSWNTSNVVDMLSVFRTASSFNQDLSLWDVSNATDMRNMFEGATVFNQDISAWSMPKARSFAYMFKNAVNFNQDISAWDTSLITNLEEMFRGASTFDQDLGAWDMMSVTSAADMFRGIAMSCQSYTGTLNGWSQQLTLNAILFSGGDSTYDPGPGQAARDILANTWGWTIIDGGAGTAGCYTTPGGAPKANPLFFAQDF